MPRHTKCLAAALSLLALALAFALEAPAAPLAPIPQGTIAVNLQPIATGLAAPDYAASPPGDTTRLFVVEQNGLLRLIQNGVPQPGAALDIQNRVQIAPV